MNISILICTWNNCQRLEVTLESLEQCLVPENFEWEVVVVDNNCTDKTQKVLSKFATALPLMIVSEPRQGLSIARNVGLKASQGELVVFADDDVRPDRSWLVTYWNAYQCSPKNCFFGGPVESEFESKPLSADLLDLAPWSVKGLSFGDVSRELDRGEYFLAANWACPRAQLARSGGFDEQLGLNPDLPHVNVGEETDLMNRLRNQGMTAQYLPDARLMHWVPRDKCTLEHIASRREANGRSRWQADYATQTDFITRTTGVPRWLWKQVFQHWISWRIGQLFNADSINRYLQYRRTLGTLKEACSSKSSMIKKS